MYGRADDLRLPGSESDVEAEDVERRSRAAPANSAPRPAPRPAPRLAPRTAPNPAPRPAMHPTAGPAAGRTPQDNAATANTPAPPADDEAAEEQEIDELLIHASRAARGERIGKLRQGVSDKTQSRDKQAEVLRKLAETKVIKQRPFVLFKSSKSCFFCTNHAK